MIYLEIINPYQNVDFSKQYKANLHGHTTQSFDATHTPQEYIDHYYNAEYKVLAITDHDTHRGKTTWPWNKYDRNPEEMGMIAIQGNELSWGHHRGSLFCDLPAWGGVNWHFISKSALATADRGGIMILNHPGQYDGRYDLDWYVDLIKKHKNVLGIEVFNQNNRWEMDEDRWDDLLTRLMPNYQVLGFSNDDTHVNAQLFRNYQYIFMDDFNETSCKQALIDGKFYFSREPGGSGDAKAPKIQNVSVEDRYVNITVDSGNIEWIHDRKVISVGASIRVPSNVNYVRARIENEHGITCTQAFGIKS